MTEPQQRPHPKDAQLGHLLRLHAFKPAQLPAHPTFAQYQSPSSSPDIASFFAEILTEAEQMITDYLESTFKVKSGEKESPPATAKIQILAHDVVSDLPPTSHGSKSTLTEAWFARISKHENAVKDGTASFEEFDAGLRKDHAKHEEEYTPDLLDANLVLDWSAQLAELGGKIGGWSDVQVEIREMVHHLPAPLNKRHFSTMVVAGRKGDEFIDAQLPVDLRGVPEAKYANDSSKVAGIYVSVEHGKLIENGSKTEWRMATASDAGGALPMWAQKMGLPGAIAKDVGLFVAWRQEQRKKLKTG